MTEKFSNTQRIVSFTILGIVLGLTGSLSFLRTNWTEYQIDFFFWWSILSTTIGLFLIVFSVWQYWEGKSQLEKNKAQVKVWMNDANGISNALQRVVRDNLDKRYSSTNDMGNAIWSVEALSKALYQSLYEERCVTEEEYRARQKKISDLIDKQQFSELEAKFPQSSIEKKEDKIT